MEQMTTGTYLWTSLAALLTICTFSFLYKDNPLYKFAEHLVVGVSAGYFAIILWHTGLQPKLFDQLKDGDWYFFWLNSDNVHYIIPAILGVLMWTRFSKKLSWISRWPIALYMGIAAGVAVPQEMKARVIEQMHSAMISSIDWNNFFGSSIFDFTSGFSSLLVFIGTIAALFYFFFSTEHKGLFKAISQFGIWILMIGFGASFGFTVMGRISLFAQRLQVLDNWTDVSLQSDKGLFTLVWIVVIGFFVVVSVAEFVKFLRSRGTEQSAE